MTLEQPVALRPFYFVMVVWGEEYRNYFLEYCLPSLLAPGNIPALAGIRPAKFLIATTAPDWDRMRQTAIFRTLERYVVPIFVPLPPHSPDRPYWMQAILGHQTCCDIAFRDQAIRVFTSPDTVCSDGMVARLHQLSRDGARVVLKLVSPLSQTKKFFETLDRFGMRPAVSARDTGNPLSYSARQIVKVAFHAMHGMSAVNEWDTPCFCGYASTPWWRIGSEDAAVLFGLFWDLILMDYSAIEQHDSSILLERGFDGDYIMRIAGNLETIYAVQDSDEFHITGWASYPEIPHRRLRLGEFGKGASFRQSAYGPGFNSMQRTLLLMPTFVHTGAIGEESTRTQTKALGTISTWIDVPTDIERYSRALPPHLRNFAGLQARLAACRLPWWRRNGVVWAACRNLVLPIAGSWSQGYILPLRARTLLSPLKIGIYRLVLVLRGDAVAAQWLRWRTRKALAALSRRPFNEPRPGHPIVKSN